MKKKIPPMPKSKSNYPTVVSDSTAHQKPSGDPFVNKGENWDAFERCSCHENQYTSSLLKAYNAQSLQQYYSIRNCGILE